MSLMPAETRNPNGRRDQLREFQGPIDSPTQSRIDNALRSALALASTEAYTQGARTQWATNLQTPQQFLSDTGDIGDGGVYHLGGAGFQNLAE